MTSSRPRLVKPGVFGLDVAADRRRGIYDAHNEALLATGLPIDAVFLGDSITEMWALDCFFQGTAGMVVNRGIGGDRTTFARRRLEADVLQLRPRLLVLMIGVNNAADLNIWWDQSLLRTPEEIEEEIVADTAAIVSTAREHGLAVALCSILPTDITLFNTTPVRNGIIARANARLRDIADAQGAVYVDYHRMLAATDGQTLRPGYADDGLHPHVVAYQIMADTLLSALAHHGITVLAARALP